MPLFSQHLWAARSSFLHVLLSNQWTLTIIVTLILFLCQIPLFCTKLPSCLFCQATYLAYFCIQYKQLMKIQISSKLICHEMRTLTSSVDVHQLMEFPVPCLPPWCTKRHSKWRSGRRRGLASAAIHSALFRNLVQGRERHLKSHGEHWRDSIPFPVSMSTMQMSFLFSAPQAKKTGRTVYHKTCSFQLSSCIPENQLEPNHNLNLVAWWPFFNPSTVWPVGVSF